MKWIVIVLMIVVVLVILLYNRLVRFRIRCDNGWAQIDNQLKRRNDLIPNLVEVTKGYAKYESETLVEIVRSRSIYSDDIKKVADSSKAISDQLTKLFALAESYPDLQANRVFTNLQVELTGTEDKIAYARQFYNDAVQLYNTVIMQFPGNILADLFHFTPREFFQVAAEEKRNVTLHL